MTRHGTRGAPLIFEQLIFYWCAYLCKIFRGGALIYLDHNPIKRNIQIILTQIPRSLWQREVTLSEATYSLKV